jgi:DNA repair exonuclease SbcCD ATPase subunit
MEDDDLQEPSAQDIPKLLETIEELKERLRDRDSRKRQMLKELKEARQQVFDYKQEAEQAKQQVKQLIIDIDAADPDTSSRLQGHGAALDGGQSIVETLETQEVRIKELSSELNKERDMVKFYLRAVEERSEAIRGLEVEVEQSRLKAMLDKHPCGEVFLPPDALADASRGRSLSAEDVGSPKRNSGQSSSAESAGQPQADELPRLVSGELGQGRHSAGSLATVHEEYGNHGRADMFRGSLRGQLPKA